MKKLVLALILMLTFHYLIGGTSNLIKYNLNNGLTVILSPNPSIQAIGVLFYHLTGVGNDPVEIRGASYLYKDLMFLGTKNLDPFEGIVFAQKNGGIRISRIGYFRSLFFQLLPDTEINNALWHEKERLTSLSLESNHIEILKNNLFQRLTRLNETNVHFRASNWVKEMVFESTIYQTPIYGKLENIRFFSDDEIKKLYQNFIDPHKIIIVITGNFNPQEAKELINRYFVDFSSSTQTQGQKYTSIDVRQKYISESWTSNNLKNNFVIYGFRLPGKMSYDYLFSLFLKYYLVDSRINKLTKELNKIYQLQIEISHEMTNYIETNGLFIKISSPNSTNVERAKYFFNNLIKTLQTKSINQSDFKLTKTMMELDFLKDTLNPETRSVFIAENFHLFKDLEFEDSILRRIRRVTPYDIIRIAKTYLKKENQVIINVSGK